jgi:uncharacterized protein
MRPKIAVDRERLAQFCRRNHIVTLSLFGSVITDRFGPDSDVDVLVQFATDHTPGLFDIARMERELSAIVGRRVDIRTAEDLSRHFREDVLAAAVPQYAGN